MNYFKFFHLFSEQGTQRSEGFEDSRIQGVEWKKAEVRSQKSEVRRQRVGKGRGLEGWRFRGLAKHPHFQTSNLLKKGGRVVCLVFFSKNKSEGAKDFTTRETRETKQTMPYIVTTVGRIKI